jgi:hypothetical protein
MVSEIFLADKLAFCDGGKQSSRFDRAHVVVAALFDCIEIEHFSHQGDMLKAISLQKALWRSMPMMSMISWWRCCR